MGEDRREPGQPVAYAAEVLGAGDHDGPGAAGVPQMAAADAPPSWLVVTTEGEFGVVAAIVDQHDRQAVAVQFGEVVQGVLGFHHDQSVEGPRRHLAGEALHGLGPAVAGEQQQPVVGGLDGVDDAWSTSPIQGQVSEGTSMPTVRLLPRARPTAPELGT